MTTDSYRERKWMSCKWVLILKPLLISPTQMLKDMMMQYHRERARGTNHGDVDDRACEGGPTDCTGHEVVDAFLCSFSAVFQAHVWRHVL